MGSLLQFVTGPLPGPVLPASYDPWLVVLSYLVASLAAYTAIDLAGRVSDYRTEPRRAAAWLAAGRSRWARASGRCTSWRCSPTSCRSRCATRRGPRSHR